MSPRKSNEHWIPGIFLGEYGKTLTVLQRYKEAETALLEAHELIFAGLGPDHELTMGAIKSLSDLYTAWHEAESDQGYDTKANEWRAKLVQLNEEEETSPMSERESDADKDE